VCLGKFLTPTGVVLGESPWRLTESGTLNGAGTTGSGRRVSAEDRENKEETQKREN
jgi:hypothetical protein